MKTWEKREKTSKRIALIASIALHIAFFATLAAYSSSGSESSLFDWAKQLFRKDKVEQPVTASQNT
jgi:hypothetical protein